MFSYITGSLVEVVDSAVVVENNGIGYLINMSVQQISMLPQRGELIKLYIYLQVKEDALSLYGFIDRDSLDFFKKLLTVSGVGPKGALGVLSVLSVNDLRTAILTQDAKAISKAPGIGAKTAQRIIIDLKDKVTIEDISLVENKESFVVMSEGQSIVAKETIEALVALGFPSKEAKEAVSKIEDIDSLTSEECLKESLKYMR